ncbi:hypothetical protein H5U35_02905 [Candidatus Aerophobetes bacterium]|nr:hypothetical protein [Candidatus Aerophobetes bacterium]
MKSLSMALPELKGPVWLMQPIPYFGESLKERWIGEPKIDGWRLQIIRYSNGKVELWGRRLEKNPNWTEKLKSLAEKAEKILPSGTLLDAELYSTGGRQFIPSLFGKSPRVLPCVYIFDVVFYREKFVGELPLEERKKILENLSVEPPFFKVKWHPLKDIEDILRKMIKEGHEGVVIKKLSSPYQIGKDGPLPTPDWRKIKPGGK